MPNDVDWQSEATKRGTNAQGRVVPVKAHITDQIPKGGHYRYKTNSNMTGNWLIGGSMKVNKVLTDAEVSRINKSAGAADLPRDQPFKKKEFGFASGGLVAPEEWKAEAHVNHKAQGGVVHLAGGGQPSIDAMKLALNQHGMYSPLEKATMGVNRTKGTAAEFLAEAVKQPGFRKEEVADRKLTLPDQKLTKPEFMAHIQKHPAPQVSEKVLHDFGDEEEALDTAAQHLFGQTYDEVYDDRKARQRAENWVKENSSQYSTYQLPGGKNYREVLLQTPHFSENDQSRIMELEADKRRSPQPNFWGKATGEDQELKNLMERKSTMGDQYHSGHWKDHPNVIAHMRMSDRTGPNGEKLLHIEEIQSDWHQDGRKKGYRVEGESMPPEKAKRMTDKIMERFNAGELTTTQRNELLDKLDAAVESNNKVPDAPFKKNWHELAIKHALHEAARAATMVWWSPQARNRPSVTT